MTVTQITELNKSRSKVYIDGELAFVLYKGEIRSYGIVEGREIAEETYQILIQEVLSKRARLRCMNLLKSREYTTAQLRQKLKEGYYPQENIDDAIAYVTSFHYLDDERYTRDYITYHINARSRKRIEMDLLHKGIEKSLIDSMFQELTDDCEEDKEEEIIREFLKKKKFHPDEMDESQKRKIIGSLYRKGFSLDKIYKVLNKFDI